MHVPPISTLPKNPLNVTLTASSSSLVSRSSPVPISPSAAQPSTGSNSAGQAFVPPMGQPDPRFVDSEVFTHKFYLQLSGSVERSKKVVRKLGGMVSSRPSQFMDSWILCRVLEVTNTP